MDQEHKKKIRDAMLKSQKEGVRLGARPKLSNDEQKELKSLFDSGHTKKDLATKYNISLSTVSRILKKFRNTS